MSGAVHTPGPLVVDELATSSGVAVRSSTGAIVAVFKHVPSPDMVGSQAEANARRFIASSGLLDALQQIARLRPMGDIATAKDTRALVEQMERIAITALRTVGVA